MRPRNPQHSRGPQGSRTMSSCRTALPSIVASLLALTLASCATTPLPIPPTADPEHITVVDYDQESVLITGGEGAVDPGGEEIRVGTEPHFAAAPWFEELVTGPDGSFSSRISGQRTDRFFIEALLEDEDLFILAFSGGPGDSAVETDPGGDRDSDGSPDAIDCAPDDPTITGRRCWP